MKLTAIFLTIVVFIIISCNKGKKVKLEFLHDAASAIEKVDAVSGKILHNAATATEKKLTKNKKDEATASLKSYARAVFGLPKEKFSNDLLINCLQAVMDVQAKYDIPGTTRLQDHCCENFQCNEYKGAVCYTIDGTRGCLGTPCPQINQ